jgi:hypothetical protein
MKGDGWWWWWWVWGLVVVGWWGGRPGERGIRMDVLSPPPFLCMSSSDDLSTTQESCTLMPMPTTTLFSLPSPLSTMLALPLFLSALFSPSWPGRSSGGGARRLGTVARGGGRPALPLSSSSSSSSPSDKGKRRGGERDGSAGSLIFDMMSGRWGL